MCLHHRSQTVLGTSPQCPEAVPEVVGAFPLPEATAGHDADACLFQELHAVEHVGGHVMGLWEQGRTQGSRMAQHRLTTENPSEHSGNRFLPMSRLSPPSSSEA